MTFSVVWGGPGVLGALLAFAFALVLLVVGIGCLVDEDEPREWVRRLQAVACFALTAGALVLTVAALWGAFHVRTVRLTVAHTEIDYGRHGESYHVDDTAGHGYDAREEVFVNLLEGDRVECRATAPLLLQGTLLSCKALPARKPPRRARHRA